MNDDDLWYFCIPDHSVRQGKQARGLDRMGPYPNKEAATRALEIAKERNKAADEADQRWNS